MIMKALVYRGDLVTALADLTRAWPDFTRAHRPHLVTVRSLRVELPRVQHPITCNLLRYGERCAFDQLLSSGAAGFPHEPGEYEGRPADGTISWLKVHDPVAGGWRIRQSD